MPPMRKYSSSSKFLTAAASAAGTVMLVRTIVHDLLPKEVQNYIYDTIRFRIIQTIFLNQLTMVFEDKDGLDSNEMYVGAEIYLGSRVSSSSKKLKVNKHEKDNIVVRMDEGEEVIDVFNGVEFRWSFMTKRSLLNDGQVTHKTSLSKTNTPPNYIKFYSLCCNLKHRQMVLEEYLPYILKESKSIKQEKKTPKIFTLFIYGVWGHGNTWTPMQLDHPSTFETLAMDSKLKKTIMEDLERFVSGSEFYRRVGKAWKRGYLLYGPPGTGKSSLIAAMANYLNFDVYDVDLTQPRFNFELRMALLATANRSILVFEDIDCSVDFVQDRKETKTTATGHKKQGITLSGFLNVIDGLWSCASKERIIIFTTNHKDKLDPALLRPGRMDMHIHMSYCTPCAFKTLAKSYLMIEEHHLFEEIEGCIEKAEVTPAEVAGELMKGNDPDIVLSGLVEFLHKKKIEHDQAKEKAAKEAEEANRKAKEAAEKADRKAKKAAAKEVEEANRKAKEAAEVANREAKEAAAKEVEEANRKAKEAAEVANREAKEAAAKEVEEANRKAKEAAENRAKTENDEKMKETQIKEKQDVGSRERKTATLIKRAATFPVTRSGYTSYFERLLSFHRSRILVGMICCFSSN